MGGRRLCKAQRFGAWPVRRVAGVLPNPLVLQGQPHYAGQNCGAAGSGGAGRPRRKEIHAVAGDRHRAFELAEPLSAADHVLGPPDSRVTVIEYGDFECPNCKQAAPAVKLLLARHAGQVRFAYRHFPLEGVHPHAAQAAQATEAAAAENRFWEMHDLLFDNQPRLQLEDLRKYAATLKLDLAHFDSAMQAGRYLPVVRKHMDTGERSGVRSTPAFFINNRIQDVSFGLGSLFDAIDAALKSK
jgi:protein-disulfide isomerase